MEKCVSPYTFTCPRLGVSVGCRLCSFESSSCYILGKSELKGFKVVMFSGAEKLTKTIWYPLYRLLPWSVKHNLGIRCPILFLGRVIVHSVHTPDHTDKGNWSQTPLKARQDIAMTQLAWG